MMSLPSMCWVSVCFLWHCPCKLVVQYGWQKHCRAVSFAHVVTRAHQSHAQESGVASRCCSPSSWQCLLVRRFFTQLLVARTSVTLSGAQYPLRACQPMPTFSFLLLWKLASPWCAGCALISAWLLLATSVAPQHAGHVCTERQHVCTSFPAVSDLYQD
jgi:hypothetical protein